MAGVVSPPGPTYSSTALSSSSQAERLEDSPSKILGFPFPPSTALLSLPVLLLTRHDRSPYPFLPLIPTHRRIRTAPVFFFPFFSPPFAAREIAGTCSLFLYGSSGRDDVRLYGRERLRYCPRFPPFLAVRLPIRRRVLCRQHLSLVFGSSFSSSGVFQTKENQALWFPNPSFLLSRIPIPPCRHATQKIHADIPGSPRRGF